MPCSRSSHYGATGLVVLTGTLLVISCSGLEAGSGEAIGGGVGVAGSILGGGGLPVGSSSGAQSMAGGGSAAAPVSGSTGTAGSGAGATGVAGSGSGGTTSAGGTSSMAGRGGMSMAGRSNGGTTSMGGTTGMAGNQNTGGSLPPIQNGCNGYATRFWDCCKPHCGWSGNVPGGVNAMKSCNRSDDNTVNADTGSSCSGGGAYTCHDLSPWALSGNIAYGYAATSSGDVCGRCYQLQFTGASHNAGDDAGSKALLGKQMIVQAINVGFDVAGHQFDLLIPGGGVGAFNACSDQWGVSNAELGAQYGGFLPGCKSQGGGNHEAVKSCMLQKCQSVFGSRGLTDLATGCRWFVEWFQAADNPSLTYKEVPCPAELYNKSGMNRNGRNDIRTGCD